MYAEKQKNDQVVNEATRKLKSARISTSFDSSNDKGNTQDMWNAEDRLSKLTRGSNMNHIITYSQYVSQKDIRKLGVEKSAIMRVVLDDEWQRKTAINFPLILLYLALFMVIFQEHYGVSYIFLQENQIRQSLIEPAKSITTTSDIFQWMNAILVPYLWSCTNVDGVTQPSTRWATANQELIGGLIVRTVRGPRAPCTNPMVSQFECFDETVSEVANDAVFNAGWNQQTRRLVDVGKGTSWRGWLGRLGLSGFEGGTATEARQRRLQIVREARRNATKDGVKRESLKENKRIRKLQEAALAKEDRRLEIINAHIKDSVPNMANFARKYQYLMPLSMGQAEVLDQLDLWQSEETKLITNTTIVLTLGFLFRNENFHRGMLTNGEISFIFSRGGTIYLESHFYTMLLSTSRMVLFGLGMWAIILLGFTLASSFKLHTAVSHGDVCSYFMHFTNFWEWLLVVSGWLIVALVLTERMGISWFNQQWEEYLVARQTASELTIKEFDRSWLGKFEKAARSLSGVDDYGQIGVAFYHIALVFRILMASQGHPRLAIVVNTISQGFNDLVHLFIVFLIIFIAFVMMGFILFGNRMEPFSTIKGSLGYCMQIVLQREYDNQAITESDYGTSLIWIGSFVIIVVLVVVNIVLAMIFDNYGDVVNTITAKDTVWHTAKRQWNHFRNYSSWVSNSEVLKALTKAGNENITKQKLFQLVPMMSGEQADEIFESVKLRLVTMVVRTKKNIVPEALAAILLGVEDLREGVRLMSTKEPVEEGEPKRKPSKEPPLKLLRNADADAAPDGEQQSEPNTAREGEEEAAQLEADKLVPQDCVTPPDRCPVWVQDGLLRHLHKRRAAMDQLYLQIQQIHGTVKKRGLGTNCDDIPLEEPEQPSRLGSKRLDSTLTGQHMKPMITPGLERAKSMAEVPRPSLTPGSFGIAARLGRSA